MSSSPRYYYVDAQNQAAGPIPLAELQSLHASSTIGDSTLVVLEGGQDWVAFSTIKPTPQPAPQPAPLDQRLQQHRRGSLSIRTRDSHHTNFFRRISIKVRRHSSQGTSPVLHTNPRELCLFCFLLSHDCHCTSLNCVWHECVAITFFALPSAE
jgi:hypothetical protein